jgi:hypothetical protein
MKLERGQERRMPSLFANAAIFVLFFGAGLLAAIRSLDWTTAMLWMLVCLMFLAMSRRPRGS